MVWPAIYVSQTFADFWFLVLGTIVIELFTIRYLLKSSWTKSFLMSFIGNLVSGFIGTFIMIFAMLFWHLIADNFVPHATFDIINWIATFILMCAGSVFLETLAIKIIYKEKIKRLFPPMMIGNLLSYIFIAIVMLTATDKDPDETRMETANYLSNKQSFILLDSSELHLDTATIRLSYDKDNNCLNETKKIGYELQIPFVKQNQNSFQFQLRLSGEKYAGGIENELKKFKLQELNESYEIVLEQKNQDTSLGWTVPVISDTLIFRRVN